MSQRHNVFVSYHHANDQIYRNKFENLFSNIYDVMLSNSVQIGDIDPNLRTETIRQKIRDKYLRKSTVTIVLIGAETWKRKHVDWEIASSIRQTEFNERSGLLGVFLPTYRKDYLGKHNPYTIPPRLHKNVEKGFAKLYDWSDDPVEVQRWIHQAFLDRKKILPDNKYPSFVNNRSGDRWY